MNHHQTEGPPCRHMEGLLNQAADGSSAGIKLWYAKSHASGCVRCGNYLSRLIETRAQLRSTGAISPSPEVLSRLEAAIKGNIE